MSVCRSPTLPPYTLPPYPPTLPPYPTGHMSIDTHSTDTAQTITDMIDRLVGTLNTNMDRLTQDTSIVQAIELVYMLQDMREREQGYRRKKTHTNV